MEFNHNETDHVLRFRGQALRPQTFAMTDRNGTKRCVACAVPQNMISLIVVEFYLVRVRSYVSQVLSDMIIDGEAAVSAHVRQQIVPVYHSDFHIGDVHSYF